MKRVLFTALACLAANLAMAADDIVITLTIENHTFFPKIVMVPADKKFKLMVVNRDSTPAEFESKPLSREKVIAGKSSASINIGPLKAGRYAFVEEYHENDAAAQGTIVAE